MAFVYHNEVIISPVDIGKIQSVAFAMISGKVSMKQDIISYPVSGYRVVLVIGSVILPVAIQFLRTQHQHRFVLVLVVFDYGKCSERFSKTYAVRKDASVVFFQLVYDCQGSVFLEVI